MCPPGRFNHVLYTSVNHSFFFAFCCLHGGRKVPAVRWSIHRSSLT
jgi:hypothetical protein